MIEHWQLFVALILVAVAGLMLTIRVVRWWRGTPTRGGCGDCPDQLGGAKTKPLVSLTNLDDDRPASAKS